MKFHDNRERSGSITDCGNTVHTFRYSKIGSSDPYDYEETEYGFYTDNGFTISTTLDELEDMVKQIKKLEALGGEATPKGEVKE